MATRKPGPWRPYADAPPGPPPPARVDGLRATFVNHATVLVQIDGLNVLTDPVWSDRTSPIGWAGPRRARPPGIRFEDLPPIDVVLVSHNHYDHLDVDTLRRLQAAHRPRVLTGLGNAPTLQGAGIADPVELDWGQGADLSPRVRATFVEQRHFSGRGLGDHDATLWGGFVVEGPGGPVYFAGDTGYGPHFAEHRARYGAPRLALLPIGAYLPRWFMSPVHMCPDEAVRAHLDLGAEASLAIHWGTFPLADDGQDEPLEALREALAAADVPGERFRALGFGEGWDLS
jgi:L-ascorbate metabolism protein UlaG (beta-lactamase superfamily)